MLELKKISKEYKVGEFVQQALKGVSLSFRKNEFVSILGESGSGKTTLLNIIGGLDRYSSGDLTLNDKSTKNFKEKQWDAYRNNCIGFVFQSYNLISHIDLLGNVEMAMTLSGVSSKVRKIKAIEALDRVGLKDHINKRPNQLSGGQMQRVAIARALVNDPEVILADEPTGALDSETSVQIMELIREIAKDKLVIMVTHNPVLAHTYSDRIIELKDGEVLSDTNPSEEEKSESKLDIRSTSMSYFTAIRLSFNNIRTKKGRTFITSFAASIGIIGISLILALSNGFQVEIDNFEKDSLSQMPIEISKNHVNFTGDSSISQKEPIFEDFTSEEKITANVTDMAELMQHKNHISEEFINYLDDIDPSLISGISYSTSVSMNLVTKNEENEYQLIKNSNAWIAIPQKKDSTESETLNRLYEVIAGDVDLSKPGIFLQVDRNNQIDKNILKQLGFHEDSEISFDQIIGKEIQIISNDDFYQEINNGLFAPNTNYSEMVAQEKTKTITIEAIIRGKESEDIVTYNSGVLYNQILEEAILDDRINSEIVKAQKEANYNVLSGQAFDQQVTGTGGKEVLLEQLGGISTPSKISIYPEDFGAKDEILAYLDAYNVGLDEGDRIQYTDMADLISSLSGNIMNGITFVLIAFSSVSLIVSSIMIGIIIYTSVLERTKEIGILRSLGARKKDITRVFNSETFLIGLFSGILGIVVSYLLTLPINSMIESASGLVNVAKMNPIYSFVLIIISLILTLLSGLIPARMAAKKDPVEALRSE